MLPPPVACTAGSHVQRTYFFLFSGDANIFAAPEIRITGIPPRSLVCILQDPFAGSLDCNYTT